MTRRNGLPENPKSLWHNAHSFKRSLVDEGWRTPNTYDNYFENPIDGPAVYLFLLHGWDARHDFHDFETAMVAYVGMSKRLKRRWEKHPILREIEISRQYLQKWFRPTQLSHLRADEHNLIQMFNPPWNIQGRKRGVNLI